MWHKFCIQGRQLVEQQIQYLAYDAARVAHVKVKVCQICGSTSYQEVILTCCKCSITSEHIYCMLSAFPSIKKDWSCEDCLKHLQEEAHLQHASTDQIMEKNSSPWVGKANQSRVKFISSAEAISLMDKQKVTRKRSITSSHSSLALKEKSQSKVENRPTVQRSLLGGYSHPPPRRFELPRAFIINTDSANAMKSFTVLNSRTKEDQNPPVAREPEYTMGLHTSHASVERHDARSTLIMGRNIAFSNAIKSFNAPVGRACWKGICDVSSTDLHVLCEMEAYFPLHVYYKVFEAIKQMPTELKTEAVPRKYIWPKIFVDDPPTSHDVGLYFLATKIKRYGEKSASLVEFLDANDFGLRCPVGDAELIIYTSSRLPAEEKGLPIRFNMWGIFHSLKSKRQNIDLQIQLAEGESVCQNTPKMAPDTEGKKAIVPEPSAKFYRQNAERNGKGFSGGPSHSKKEAALATDREVLHRKHHSGVKRPMEQSDKKLNKELKLKK